MTQPSAPAASGGSDGRAEQKRGAATSWLALFAGTSTLVCCALPALLVTLGAGASLATLVSVFPQIVWLSEHSAWVFGVGAVMLALGGAAQWQQRHAPCPIDPDLRQACMTQRRRSARIYGASVLLFGMGAWFAFVQPWLAAA